MYTLRLEVICKTTNIICFRNEANLESSIPAFIEIDNLIGKMQKLKFYMIKGYFFIFFEEDIPETYC